MYYAIPYVTVSYMIMAYTETLKGHIVRKCLATRLKKLLARLTRLVTRY